MIVAVAGGAHAYSSVLALGDSLSDNGQWEEATVEYNGYTVPSPYAASGNTNPYDAYGFGRFSNGPVWVEYLAQDLEASLMNVAYGGATTGMDNPAAGLIDDPETPENEAKTGLQWQAGLVAALNPSGIADNTLITISAGGNDMFNGRSATDAAANIAGVITYLMNIGGDAFMVMNLSTTQQDDEDMAWMNTFNATLAAYLSGLGTLNPDVNFYLLDLSTFVADVDEADITWQTACTENPATCNNITYAWFDEVGVHPTSQVHEQIARKAANMVPEPASILLLILGFAGLAGVRRKMK